MSVAFTPTGDDNRSGGYDSEERVGGGDRPSHAIPLRLLRVGGDHVSDGLVRAEAAGRSRIHGHPLSRAGRLLKGRVLRLRQRL